MKKSLIIVLSLLLAGLICLFGILYFKDKNPTDNDKPSTSQLGDEKSEKPENETKITISVILEDKSSKVFKISTKEKTLADTLLQEKLISKEEYDKGFYTVINGISADYTADGYWWCIKVNGEDSMVGANEIILKDGDNIEIIRTPA